VTASDALAALDAAIAAAAPEELPDLVGRLVAAEERARLRLRVETTGNGHRPEPEPAEEVMLTPEQAVEAIGNNVGVKWLYRHTKGLKFRRGSRKVIRFERAGLLRWWTARRV